jgi:hypothetical protein
LEEDNAVIDEAPPEEDGLKNDDDDDTVTNFLDVAHVDQVMRNADGSCQV